MIEKIKVAIKKKVIFKKFFVSCIIILTIPLCISIIAYWQVIEIIEEDAIESRRFMLNHIQTSVDQYIKSLDDFSTKLVLDNKIERLMNYKKPEEGSPDIYWFYEFFKDMQLNTVINKGLDGELYLFFKESEAVFSVSRLVFGFKEHYENYLSFNGESYTQWHEKFINKQYVRTFLPECEVVINGEERMVIPYLISMPLIKNTRPNGIMCFFINQEKISSLLKGANINNLGYTYIIDNKGTYISGSGTRVDLGEISPEIYSKDEGYSIEQIGGKDIFCIYKKSKVNNWTYITVLPVSDVMSKADNVKQIAIIILLGGSVLGLILAVCLTYWNTKPFKHVMSTLKEFLGYDHNMTRSDINDYDFLQGSISSLISKNKVMNSSITYQREIIKRIFWDRVLNGEFQTKKDIEVLMEQSGLKYEEKKFVVSIIKISAYDTLISAEILEERAIYRQAIEELCSKVIGDLCSIHILKQNEIVLIFDFPGDFDMQFKQVLYKELEKINQMIFECLHIRPIFGVGKQCKSLLDIPISLEQAQQAVYRIDGQTLNEKNIYWYDEIKVDTQSYFYPSTIEQKLINCTKAGNKEDIKATLDMIYQENYKQRILVRSIERLLFYDMQATLVKLLENMPVKTIVVNYKLVAKQNAVEFFRTIEGFYFEICDYVIDNNKKKNTKIKEEILTYVDHHYMDNTICVSSVASEFNFSESYFSQYFKEYVGVNFRVYVERARISKACDLIHQNRYCIDDIAKQVGYSNAHSFRRAFKKVMGVAPTEYLR